VLLLKCSRWYGFRLKDDLWFSSFLVMVFLIVGDCMNLCFEKL